MTQKSIVIDVDLVLCASEDKSVPYYERKPYPFAAKWLKRLKENGFYIRIQTARGMDQFKRDVDAVEEYHLPRLVEWLTQAGIPFDEVYFGKAVTTTYYVDDLAFRVESTKGEGDWHKLAEALGLLPEPATV